MNTSNTIIESSVRQRTGNNANTIPQALWEPRALSSMTTIEQQQLTEKKRKRMKRCYGNRKLRRFKKKCRKRQKTEAEIQQLINGYNCGRRNQNNSTQQRVTTASTVECMEIETAVSHNENSTDQSRKITATTTDKKSSHKRKRMLASASSRSISRLIPDKKKQKSSTREKVVLPTTSAHVKSTCRIPKYCKLVPNLFFQTLRLYIHHSLKKKKEKQYVHKRLQLLDRQYRLELHRNLWQSYLTLGSQHQLWAVSIRLLFFFLSILSASFSIFFSLSFFAKNQVCKLAKTNQHTSCQQFVTNRLTTLSQEYDQYTMKLIAQSHACPSTLLPLNILDQNLLKFVHLQVKYILNKINAQLTRYKEMLHEKELYQNLFNSNLTVDQVNNIFMVQKKIFFFVISFFFLEHNHRSSQSTAAKSIRRLRKILSIANRNFS